MNAHFEATLHQLDPLSSVFLANDCDGKICMRKVPTHNKQPVTEAFARNVNRSSRITRKPVEGGTSALEVSAFDVNDLVLGQVKVFYVRS